MNILDELSSEQKRATNILLLLALYAQRSVSRTYFSMPMPFGAGVSGAYGSRSRTGKFK